MSKKEALLHLLLPGGLYFVSEPLGIRWTKFKKVWGKWYAKD